MRKALIAIVILGSLGCGSEDASTARAPRDAGVDLVLVEIDSTLLEDTSDTISPADVAKDTSAAIDTSDTKSVDSVSPVDTKPPCLPWDGGTVCGGNACGKTPDGCGGTSDCGCGCRLYETCGAATPNHCGGCKLAPLKEPCTVGGKAGKAIACPGGYAPKFSPCVLGSSAPDGDGGFEYYYCCDAAITTGTSPC